MDVYPFYNDMLPIVSNAAVAAFINTTLVITTHFLGNL